MVNGIISSAPATAAPNGFMRKVTRIQNTNDGKVEVHPAKANVAELLDEADISVDQPFDAVDVQRATAFENGCVVYAAAQKRAADHQDRENFNFVLYDQDDNHNTTDDQITVSGSSRCSPGWWWTSVPPRLRPTPLLWASSCWTRMPITISAKLKKELRRSKRIARIPLPPYHRRPAGLRARHRGDGVTWNIRARARGSGATQSSSGGRRQNTTTLHQDQHRQHQRRHRRPPPSRAAASRPRSASMPRCA